MRLQKRMQVGMINWCFFNLALVNNDIEHTCNVDNFLTDNDNKFPWSFPVPCV